MHLTEQEKGVIVTAIMMAAQIPTQKLLRKKERIEILKQEIEQLDKDVKELEEVLKKFVVPFRQA